VTSTSRTRTIRRLRTAIIFAAVRGAATTTGSALIGLVIWGTTHR
jgi:hypothetical protein